jgi:hypothetical protein
LAAEALLDGEAEALTRKVIELALAGDGLALRLCMDRLVPRRKDRSVDVDLVGLEGRDSYDRLLAGVCVGQLTPAEAQTLAGVLEGRRKAIELDELEARITALEGGAT